MNKEQTNIEGKKIDAGAKWGKVESPNFIEFKKIGDTVEGMLTDKDSSDRYGFGIYTIMTKEGEQKRFHGSKQLDDLMLGVELQDYIRVTYIDNQNLPQGTLKLFEVMKKE